MTTVSMKEKLVINLSLVVGKFVVIAMSMIIVTDNTQLCKDERGAECYRAANLVFYLQCEDLPADKTQITLLKPTSGEKTTPGYLLLQLQTHGACLVSEVDIQK